jgi:hypothetical protein
MRFLLHRCCAAAWDKKMRDAEASYGITYIHKGGAASAAVSHSVFVYKSCFNSIFFSSFYLWR